MEDPTTSDGQPTFNPIRKAPGGAYAFVHINKTGGTSVCHALGIPDLSHLTVQEMVARVGEAQFRAALVFTVVRNPWDKVVSHYSYRSSRYPSMIGGLSFKDWVGRTYVSEPDHAFYDNPRMFQPHVEWLRNNEGAITADRILRFETLERDFARLAKQLGIDVELQHLKASKRGDFRHYYDAKTADAVAKWFAEDIDYFGYTFPKLV